MALLSFDPRGNFTHGGPIDHNMSECGLTLLLRRVWIESERLTSWSCLACMVTSLAGGRWLGECWEERRERDESRLTAWIDRVFTVWNHSHFLPLQDFDCSRGHFSLSDHLSLSTFQWRTFSIIEVELASGKRISGKKWREWWSRPVSNDHWIYMAKRKKRNYLSRDDPLHSFVWSNLSYGFLSVSLNCQRAFSSSKQ